MSPFSVTGASDREGGECASQVRPISRGVSDQLTGGQTKANPYVERLIGSIRRECPDHVIVLGEAHLRRILGAYIDYYHGSRTHLSLDKDAPNPREVQSPTMGEVIELPEVGGLHHRYERRAA